jgi:hypothetical protein
MLMKAQLLALAIITVLFGGCSTNYYTYSGSGIYEGKGGASKSINGSRFGWSARPRESSGLSDTSLIVGQEARSRWSGEMLISPPKQRRTEAMRSCSKADRTDFVGVYSTGNATAFTSGNTTTAFGSGVSVPMRRREGEFFVIKYVD